MLKIIFEKLKNKFLIFFYCQKIDECLYGRKIIKNKQIKKVLFYFPFRKYMHLGDHLFFEPVMKKLVKLGYDVYVFPSKNMEFYFRKLNYKLITQEININSFDLVITRSEFYKFISKLENVLLYDYINLNLKEKICKDIIDKIFKYLNIIELINENDTIPSKIKIEEKKDFKLNEKEKYVLFNNYLDSGKGLNIFENYNKKFEEKILILKKQGYKIIHLGTEKERIKDKNRYRYIDIDLRGKTTVEDLFYLASLKNIKINIGFDAFIMHLFFINNKKNYIILRNKLISFREKITKNYLNPPFKKRKKEKIRYL